MVAEELDPKKYHRWDLMLKQHKTLIVIVPLVIVLVLLPVLGLTYYKTAVHRPSQTTNETTIDIGSGANVSSIAAQLYDAGAINSEFLFKFYVIVNNLQNALQAGVYTISAGTSLVDVTAMLQHGTNDKTVIFLEGWRNEEFARQASRNFQKIDYAEFLLSADGHIGYLFPDTYNFSVNVTEQEMIEQMVNNFKAKTEGVLTEEAILRSGLTESEILILASIVEREISNEEDRPVVAGILLKRWQEGTKLDADATTQYAVAAGRYGCAEGADVVCPNEEEIPNVEWWPNNLTVTEIDSDSPYNTRKVVGLPPTPIANPGLNAIQAVLNYENTPYYYYLTDEDGTTRYAETLEGHNLNVERWL